MKTENKHILDKIMNVKIAVIISFPIMSAVLALTVIDPLLLLALLAGGVNLISGGPESDMYFDFLLTSLVFTAPFIITVITGFFLYRKSSKLKLTARSIYVLILILSFLWMNILKIYFFFILRDALL